MSMSRDTECTNDLLVRRAQEGCENAFAALIERNRWIVFALAWSALGNRPDVDDAVQEVNPHLGGCAAKKQIPIS